MEFNIKKMFHQHQFLIKQNPVQQQILSKYLLIIYIYKFSVHV